MKNFALITEDCIPPPKKASVFLNGIWESELSNRQGFQNVRPGSHEGKIRYQSGVSISLNCWFIYNISCYLAVQVEHLELTTDLWVYVHLLGGLVKIIEFNMHIPQVDILWGVKVEFIPNFSVLQNCKIKKSGYWCTCTCISLCNIILW